MTTLSGVGSEKDLSPARSFKLSVSLFRDALILFPVTSLTVILGSLFVGVPVSGLHAVLSIPLCLFFAFHWQEQKVGRSLLTAALLFVLTFGTTLIASMSIVDMEYDSRSYHGPAVIALSDGWNPIRQPEVCGWSATHCTPTSRLVDHYPKAQWLVSASLYSLFGNIECGKSMNAFMLILTFIVSYDFTLSVSQGRRWPALLLASVLAMNPVALAQLFCGYLDGLLASVFTTYAILLIDYVVFRQRKKLFQAALMLPYLVNIKFTGLVYSLVLTTIVVLFVALKKKRFPRLLVLVPLIAFITSVSVLGFNPYITNIVERRNPFFPAYRLQAGQDILSDQADAEFLLRNRIVKFGVANFSVPEKVDNTYRPELVAPLSRWDVQPAVDSRFSGFGPAFSGIMILAALQFLLPGDTKYKLLALVVFVTVFSTSAAWWARLAPQTWLAVCLVEIGAVATTKKGRSQGIALLVLLLMTFNSVLVLGGVTRRQRRMSAAFFRHLEIVRKMGVPVQIWDNKYRLFGFYNRRKVLDSLGESTQIVDECQPFRRNRIFRVCGEISRTTGSGGN